MAKAEELAPDVVLMDVRMPGVDGIEATRRIAETVPTAKILMLTVSDEEEDLYEAIKAGATGYLLKEISIEEVADAVRAVVAGPEPDQPVDGVQAAQRVQHPGQAGRGEAAVPAPRAHRPRARGAASSWPRA